MNDPGVKMLLAFAVIGVAVSVILVCWTLGRLIRWVDTILRVREEVRQARRLIDRLEELGLDIDEFLEIEELEALFHAS